MTSNLVELQQLDAADVNRCSAQRPYQPATLLATSCLNATVFLLYFLSAGDRLGALLYTTTRQVNVRIFGV